MKSLSRIGCFLRGGLVQNTTCLMMNKFHTGPQLSFHKSLGSIYEEPIEEKDDVEDEFIIFRRLTDTEFIRDTIHKGLNDSEFEYEEKGEYDEMEHDIKVKTPDDSCVELELPFSTEEKLRVSFQKGDGSSIRLGRILEDLDSLAAEIAYRHCDGLNPENPLTIVTASLHRMDLQKEVDMTKDLMLEGCPIYVGRSSIVIYLRVFQKEGGEEVTNLEAYFTMVAKSTISGKTVMVNRLQPKTEEEKRLYKLAEGLEKVTLDRELTPDDLSILHDLYSQKKGEEVVHVGDTETEQMRYMYPQRRNIHGQIFGGYLMRRATEVAWITACSFVKHKSIRFQALDDNMFILPVEIGSLVRFRSVVVYTNDRYILVRTELTKINNYKFDEISNIFYYTFYNEKGSCEKHVVPHTYDEGIMYLEGRNIFLKNKI